MVFKFVFLKVSHFDFSIKNAFKLNKYLRLEFFPIGEWQRKWSINYAQKNKGEEESWSRNVQMLTKVKWLQILNERLGYVQCRFSVVMIFLFHLLPFLRLHPITTTVP